jgi:predicted RNase H-like HicB family nuclease
MPRKVSTIIEKDGDGLFAHCPDLPGCHSQGDTFEEALANIREAAELYLDVLDEGEEYDLT